MGEFTDFFRGLIYGEDGKISPAKIAGLGAAGTALYGALKPDSGVGEFMGMGSSQRPVGYSKGIPEYGITRALLPDAFANTTLTGAPRVPGSGGRRYFTDTTYTPTEKFYTLTDGSVIDGVEFKKLVMEAWNEAFGDLTEEEKELLQMDNFKMTIDTVNQK